MRRAQTAALMLGMGACGAALLGGCGSQTKTVTAANAPASSQTASQPTSTTKTTPTSTSPTPTSTGGGTPAPTTTHSAPEPAFTQQEAHAEGGGAAAALVRSKGFTPNDVSQYHPKQTLRVLVGTRSGSGDGYGQQAFFFVDGRYIGTDSSEPSATLKLLSQSDTEVTLAYPLYKRNDPLCCASGGQASVRFQLNNGKLTALGQIPPVNSTSGLSRQ